MRSRAPTSRAAPAAPVREWATFDDPDDPKRQWVVDVTWLTSPWQCVFGCGCQGVLTAPTPEMEQGCCSYGAHFSDEADRDRVLALAQELRAMVGDRLFESIAAYLDGRRAATDGASPAPSAVDGTNGADRGVLVPHPAVRRR